GAPALTRTAALLGLAAAVALDPAAAWAPAVPLLAALVAALVFLLPELVRLGALPSTERGSS
ncbi:MAG TPA: hypothetical protein VGD67_04705, partial [Pseudonocardiaceae bacterium]